MRLATILWPSSNSISAEFWAWGYGQRVWDLPDERVNRKGRP